METGAHVDRTSYAVRQGYRSGKNLAVGGGKTPEKVKLQWKKHWLSRDRSLMLRSG